MSDYTIKIENGHLTFVYSDELADLMDVGVPHVCRASHVEPHPTKTGWVADMTPSAVAKELAVVIGANGTWFLDVPGVLDLVEPFKTRADALAAERAWLTVNKGL